MSEIDTHTIDPSAASPGAILKRCREYHEITLEEAEETTKIGANYLQALEEDQIGFFASPAYLKGFLRIYATYLGLNPDDMIRQFDKLRISCSTQSDCNKNTDSTAEPPPRNKFPLQKLVMPATLLVLILITAAIINRSPSPPLRQSQSAPVVAPAATPAVQPAQPVRSSAQQHSPTIKADEVVSELLRPEPNPAAQTKVQASPIENTKGFIVRMKVTQSGNLTVTIDGATSQGYDLAVGDVIEWKADRTITLELSNSGGVDVDLNGKLLKPFGQPGKPAVVALDAEGIKQ